MQRFDRLVARLAPLALACVMLLPASGPARGDADDDLFLFTTSVAPNVAIMLDNSGSMNHLVWHPAFDPTKTPTCAYWDNNTTYFFSSNSTQTRCSRKRTIYHDTSSVSYTQVTGRYLNWLFSPEADPYIADIDNSSNGKRVCGGPGAPTYAKYQRNRMRASKQVVLDTICRVEATKEVRFGLAVFREAMDAAGVDPNGGFLEVGIDDNTPDHASDLEAAISNEKADTATPLGEALFQVYTYFMSRDASQLPPGRTAGTFPKYSYSVSPSGGGGKYDTSGPPNVPGDPVQYSCQKNFVIVITDGEPTMDDFDSDPASTAYGFSSFGSLIGDYNADGETEVPGGANEVALYLDDVAKFMHENDMRPDMPGDQTLDIYTIGFTTNGTANALLKKAAEQGNGIFYSSNNAEELTTSIVAAITDIIEKSQSFTAATVPSTRTSAGGDFYTSFFLPSAKRAFWEGHLRAFGIDAAGNLFDKDGNCPLVDPTPGECNSGPFVAGAAYFWDAGEQVPASASRKLYTTKLSAGSSVRVDFDTTLKAVQLGVLPFAVAGDPAPNPIYPGSNAVNAEGLTQEIVSFARGCAFGTGVSGTDVAGTVSCVERPWRLGDIFHSSPIVVGKPNRASGEASYAAFYTKWAGRKRVIYAGANDGFLHGFDAGYWNAAATPPTYTRGTGEELMGVMPWEARVNIKNLPIDSPASRHYYTDGSPAVADVWIYPTPTTGTKAANGLEWRTGLVAGMRQGGRGYFALDVTDPSDPAYPQYVWDFPGEADPNDPSNPTSILPYLGQSWPKPVLTKIRVRVDGNDNGGAGFERWVMILSGGFDPNGDPNDLANYNSAAIRGRAILIVDLKTGKLLAMKRFLPGAAAGDPQRLMKYAIPSTPAVFDLDSDGFADVIYVGDLGGQMFKWVISPIGEDRVNDSSGVGDYTQPSWPFKLFFSAPVISVSGVSYYKSFFFPPSGAFVSGDLWLSMGTGERANLGFPGVAGKDENNRIYALRDLDPFERWAVPQPTLVEANLTDLSGTQTCTSITDPGYYFKLADGEKIVTNSEIFAHQMLVGSFIPAVSGDPCVSKGSGRLYVFRVNCGGGYFTDATGSATRGIDIDAGMPTDPQISVGVDGQDNMVFVEKSGADLESIEAPDVDENAKSLLYWRELR